MHPPSFSFQTYFFRFVYSYADHFYGGGDVCDLTGNPRSVQVRLKYVLIASTLVFCKCAIAYENFIPVN